jgi:uncharacterized protein RhaS with RHS repeats
VFLNNRYYDPSIGVFLSVDPLVDKTGQPYTYANGNPTTLSDPSGLAPCANKYGRCTPLSSTIHRRNHPAIRHRSGCQPGPVVIFPRARRQAACQQSPPDPVLGRHFDAADDGG